MEEDKIKTIRLKLYLGSLLPINLDLIKGLDLSKINPNKNQVFVYKKDIHREIFSEILLLVGQKTGRKPSFNKITLDEMVAKYFDHENPDTSKYLEKDILFVICYSTGLQNKIYGPILDRFVEERNSIGKRTFVFYKGDISKFNALKSNTLDEIIDLNIPRVDKKRNEVL